MEQLRSGLELILDILTGQEFHTIRIVLAELLQELLVGQVLAAEGKHQHGACIRMTYEICEQLTGGRMIMTGLGAAERMRIGIETLDAALHDVLIHLHKMLRHIIDTAHGRDDPDLISRADLTVRTHEALEGLDRHGLLLRHRRLVGILHLAGQIRLHIVGMHPLTRLHILGGVTDGNAVLDDLALCRDRRDGYLVSLWDVLRCDEVNVVDLDFITLRDRSDGHDDIVLRADVHYLCSCHNFPPETTGRSSDLSRPMM